MYYIIEVINGYDILDIEYQIIQKHGILFE